jgi:hypothetical protein
MSMASDEANLWISAIVGDALTLARAIGISELDIVAGFSAALLDVAKNSDPEACRGAFLQAAKLLEPCEGNS